MATSTIDDGEEYGFCEECQRDLPLTFFTDYDSETNNTCDACLDFIEEDSEYDEDYDPDDEDYDPDDDPEFEE